MTLSLFSQYRDEFVWCGPRKGVHIGGVKASKNRSVAPEGVQYDRLIILKGCSLTAVSLHNEKPSRPK